MVTVVFGGLSVPAYNFSAITAAQALGITTGDSLVMDLGTGGATSVVFSSADQVTIVAGGRTVVFGLGVASIAKNYPGGGSLFIGGGANDQQALDAGSDALYGGVGNDTLGGGAADDLLQGNQGADSLNGGAGYDIVYGGQDNDVIDTGVDPSGGRDFGQGNRGDDTIMGGGGGTDTLLGGQGNDLLNASSVKPVGGGTLEAVGDRFGMAGDFLNGNLGNDTIFAGLGDDRIFGEDGDDYIQDLGGRNVLDAGAGNDTIVAVNATASNTVSGGAGNDVILLGGSNTIDAGAGDDQIGFSSLGAVGARSVLQMGDGNDFCIVVGIDARNPADRFTIDGGAGNDGINGSDGSDSITGGSGNDTIDGWAGADTVAGGSGVDTFEFFSGEAFTNLSTLDQIIDWSVEDRLFFGDVDIDSPIPAGTPATYVEGIRADYASALAFANAQIGGGTVDYVAVEVGGDVFVFCDSVYDGGVADSAVKLVGRTLADISFSNFTDIGS